MGKRLDLLTRAGLESACTEFEEMGKELNPIGYMVATATAEQTANEIENEIQKGKRPTAEVLFREFFMLLMIESLREESNDESSI